MWLQVGFLGNGISISLSELCVSALASIINNYLGWMKKQIKSMIKRVFKQKGMAELGRQIVQAVTAPLGYVFTQFENGLGAKLEQSFIKISDFNPASVTLPSRRIVVVYPHVNYAGFSEWSIDIAGTQDYYDEELHVFVSVICPYC